jgi:hypothetical protein
MLASPSGDVDPYKPDDFLNMDVDAIQATDLCGCLGEVLGRETLGDVSDGYGLPPGPPAGLRPVRMALIGPQGATIAPAILVEATDKSLP